MDRTRRSVVAAAAAAATAPLPAAAAYTGRVRPGDAAWPSPEDWAALGLRVGGTLIRPVSPFAPEAGHAAAAEADQQLRNPFFLGEHPALTQCSGWAEAWTATPSAYTVVARHAADVAATVDFARAHRLRLVVRGGGHSYHGQSSAPDSLMVWTRRMREATLHEAFVPYGCEGRVAETAAVSLGAGALWLDAYRAVTTEGGRYVQGGGCTTVGVAGLLLGGGFGSFSKRYGIAAASLLEAEIVTGDGAVRIANACSHPDLFWALKGGGAGFGIVTRVTLATHALPETFGGAFLKVRAESHAAYRRLIARFLDFYAEDLLNPHWGEIVRVRRDDTLDVAMVFQGLSAEDVTRLWRPFLGWIAAAPEHFMVIEPFRALALPARRMWDVAWLRANAPGVTVADARPGAPAGNFVWAGDAAQAGQFIHGYDSAWLPVGLLAHGQIARLADALFEASRHAAVALHFNKGLAGAAPEALAGARETAIHPAARDAFALVISGAEGPPRFPGQPAPPLNNAAARRDAERVGAAIARLRQLSPNAGSYVWESDYFARDWQQAFWGASYPRLLAVKRRYDPEGLFVAHHSVGSEER